MKDITLEEQQNLFDQLRPYALGADVMAGLTEDERTDVVQDARLRLADRPWRPDRGALFKTYCERLVSYAALALKETNRRQYTAVKAAFIENANTEDYVAFLLADLSAAVRVEIDLDRERFRRLCQDELTRRLATPRYRVDWTEPYQPAHYIENPFHIPNFDLVPAQAGVIGYRIKELNVANGRRILRKERASLTEEYVMNEARAKFKSALVSFVPEYLDYAAWASLAPHLKFVVKLVNKESASPSTIRSKMHVSRQTYASYVATLARRGYMEVYSPRKQRCLYRYVPACDGVGAAVRAQILATLTDQEYTCVYEAFLDRHELDGKDLDDRTRRQLADQTYERIRERIMNELLLTNHDQRLRRFISDLVERPCYTAGIDIDYALTLFSRLPLDRQRTIVFKAIKSRRSIADVLALPDHYPEECLFASERSILTLV